MSRWGRSGGRNLVLHDVIGSTHRTGLALLARAAPGGAPSWIFAFEQRQGEGRRGRAWSSPPGLGVYASYVLALPREAVGLLPLALGVALCDALGVVGLGCRLKWPNDILLAGKKLGGILVQARGFGPSVGVVASFGVNLGHRREDLPREDATSLTLAAEGLAAAVPSVDAPPGAAPVLDLARLSIVLAEAVESRLGEGLSASGPGLAALLARYRELSAHRLGDLLTVTAGDRVLEGRFAGFASTGQLRLATPGGELLVGAGEVA
jgi:BirA family biotin operon repressor/biotin-[acetyl-CoA-carboxylase] ligase